MYVAFSCFPKNELCFIIAGHVGYAASTALHKRGQVEILRAVITGLNNFILPCRFSETQTNGILLVTSFVGHQQLNNNTTIKKFTRILKQSEAYNNKKTRMKLTDVNLTLSHSVHPFRSYRKTDYAGARKR